MSVSANEKIYAYVLANIKTTPKLNVNQVSYIMYEAIPEMMSKLSCIDIKEFFANYDTGRFLHDTLTGDAPASEMHCLSEYWRARCAQLIRFRTKLSELGSKIPELNTKIPLDDLSNGAILGVPQVSNKHDDFAYAASAAPLGILTGTVKTQPNDTQLTTTREETKMAILKSVSVITLINDRSEKDYSDKALIELITDTEKEISELKKIETESSYVKKQIQTLTNLIKEVSAILDNRDEEK